ncbi:MAG: VCBS repeat-containing protein, partial [Verrucomicrobia bacterium]|nr:VCBS repeat-containing protein [Verrucomicrobiota bacterium]
QIYLSEIRYGPGAPPWNQFHFLRFEYEDRPDWFEDCRSGFIVRTGKRLKTITVATQGPALAGHLAGDFNQDGTPDCLIRRYDLEYLDYAGTNTHWSLLARVTPVGADGSSAMPSSTFGYAVCNPANHAYATNAVILSLNEPTTVMDNPLAELIDLNGDGLPDILRTFAGGAVPNRGYLNRGLTQTNGSRFIQWAGGIDLGGDARASSYALSSNTVHLADMDGDGLSDLVVNSFNDTVFYFTNRANLTWGTRGPGFRQAH